MRGVKVLKKHSLTLMAYLIVGGLSFLFNDNHYYAFISNQAGLFLLSLFAFQVCDKQHMARSVLYALTAYHGYILATDWYFDYVTTTQWALEVLFFSGLAVFQVFKNYELESDKYNAKNVMLAFYRPKRARDYLPSIFGAPVSSMSVISGNDWYMFRRKSATLQQCKLVKRKLCDYVLIDTGVQISENIQNELDMTVGSNARTLRSFYVRSRCVLVFSGVLTLLGGKWKLGKLDFMPSVYLLKRLKKCQLKAS